MAPGMFFFTGKTDNHETHNQRSYNGIHSCCRIARINVTGAAEKIFSAVKILAERVHIYQYI
jgi:hypothetical protein